MQPLHSTRMEAVRRLLLIALFTAAAYGDEGRLVENVACTRDVTQTYSLYLPAGYSTATKHPVLFVFDPRGRGSFAAQLFRTGADDNGWILLSSNNTRSDGSWDVNVRALDAMVPELDKYAVDPQRIYAAGFSGGATVAWVLVRARHFAGVINAGQPWQAEIDTKHASFGVWGATGAFDFNNGDVRRIDAEVAQSGQAHHVEVFDGVHQWMPEALARRAIAWHELQAMRGGRRANDAPFLERELAAEMKRAADETRELPALRQYESIVRDFAGIHDTAEAARKASELRNSARVREQLRAERDADDYEKRELANVIDRLSRALADNDSPPAAERRLGLARMQRDASQVSEHGFAARRVLEALFAQCGFYLPQKYLGTRDYNRAAIVLGIAASVQPDRANIQFDLARAQARSGRTEKALTALANAVRLGLRDVDAARADADLESLRTLPRFEEILRGAAR